MHCLGEKCGAGAIPAGRNSTRPTACGKQRPHHGGLWARYSIVRQSLAFLKITAAQVGEQAVDVIPAVLEKVLTALEMQVQITPLLPGETVSQMRMRGIVCPGRSIGLHEWSFAIESGQRRHSRHNAAATIADTAGIASDGGGSHR